MFNVSASPFQATQGRRRLARLAVCAAFVLSILFARPTHIGGDTYWYVLDIRNNLGHGWADAPRLWNFAHLLWRPFGWLLAKGFLPAALTYTGDQQAGITLLLIAFNVVCALVCTLLIESAIAKLTNNPLIAALISVAFFYFSPILNYSRTGSPYVAGLAFSMAGLYVATFSAPTWRRASLAGFLTAVAAGLWIPYVLSFPAVLFARQLLQPSEEKRRFDLRFCAAICLAGGVTLLACYAVALKMAHISSVAAFTEWIHESSSDVRDRTALRMAAGVARGLYNLGDEALWLKWYVFHDPYARVTFWDVARESFAKLALFYAFAASLIWTLWSSREGRRILGLVAAATVPHVMLAAAYESGSPERYVPTLGVVAMAAGYAIGSPAFSRQKRVVLAVLCCLPAPMNLAMSAETNERLRYDIARISTIADGPPSSMAYVLNTRDDVVAARYSAPFDPVQRRSLPAPQTLLPFGGKLAWRQEFACSAFRAWERGGDVWVTERTLAERPQREWRWVEGDDRRISWAEIYSFFGSLPHSQPQAGTDGFFLLENTPSVRAILQETVRDSGSGSCPGTK